MHHAAAVYDQQKQRLSLYVDGKLDTPNGAPCAENPADLSVLGSYRYNRGELSLGSANGGTCFIGSLGEVSIFRGALKPSELSFHQEYPSPKANATAAYVASGSYQSPPCDWDLAATPTDLTVAADLRGGEVTATVELSNDGFRSVASTVVVRVRDGVNTYPLGAIRTPGKVRLRLDLAASPDAAESPVIDGFRLEAAPPRERSAEQSITKSLTGY